MIHKESWMKDIIAKLQQHFSDRLLFVGLQGSYLRGEATVGSDFDVMVVLDELSISDLEAYRSMVEIMPESEKVCGFVCGRAELANWPRYEIFQLKQDTKSYFGELDSLLPAYDEADIRQSVAIATANLYHAVNHSFLFGDSDTRADSLKALYKPIFFIIQLVEYLRTGEYHHSKAALFERLTGNEKELMAININWEKAQSDVVQNPNKYFERLSGFCKELLMQRVRK